MHKEMRIKLLHIFISTSNVIQNLTKDATIAKRSIQKAIEEKFSAKFNVICANGDFSYVAYTETYCQTSNDDVTCYAFKPL